jgi:DNA topoisomerase-6 subunit B
MKACLADLYRKVSAQIRRELRIKEAESRLRLYRHYIPFIVNAISESIDVDAKRLFEVFNKLAERHVRGEISSTKPSQKEDKISEERIQEEVGKEMDLVGGGVVGIGVKIKEEFNIHKNPYLSQTFFQAKNNKNKILSGSNENKNKKNSPNRKQNNAERKNNRKVRTQLTLDTFDKPKKVRKEGVVAGGARRRSK